MEESGASGFKVGHCEMDRIGLAWLEQSIAASTERVAVVVLNTPQRAAFLRKLWSLPQTAIRVAADGGANRLACAAPELTPEVVVGDMDSASPAVLRDFAARGVKVLDQHEDQDSTDFEKALHVVIAHGGCDRVYVLGEAAGVDGRLDHLFATLCVLVAFQHRLRILVVSDKCALQMVSEPTDGALRSAHALQAIPGCHCGLVPIGRPCRAVTTRGLEYDMDETPMAYGGLVSACNIARANVIQVTTADPLLWTITFDADQASGAATSTGPSRGGARDWSAAAIGMVVGGVLVAFVRGRRGRLV